MNVTLTLKQGETVLFTAELPVPPKGAIYELEDFVKVAMDEFRREFPGQDLFIDELALPLTISLDATSDISAMAGP